MGVHTSKQIDLYWRNESDQGPIHLPQRYISQTRWQQLKGCLHISDPRDRNPSLKLPKSAEQLQKKEWWYKLEPLASTFRDAYQKYYTTGSNVSIDELMIQFFFFFFFYV